MKSKMTNGQAHSSLPMKENLRSEIEDLAREHALQGKPIDRPQYDILGVHAMIETSIQEAINENNRQHLLQGAAKVLSKHPEEPSAALRRLQAEQSDRRKSRAALIKELETVVITTQEIVLRLVVGLILIVSSIAEGVLAFDGFRYAQFGRWASILLSTGVATAVACGAFYGADFTMSASSKNSRYARGIFILGLFASIFAYVGTIRAGALNTNNSLPGDDLLIAVTGPAVCWCTIAGLSFGLFLVTFCLELYIWRDKGTKRAEADYLKRKRRLSELNTEHGATAVEIETLQAAISTHNTENAYSTTYYATTEADLVCFARIMVERYREVNLRYRTDVPAFFSALPTFNFTKFFNEPAITSAKQIGVASLTGVIALVFFASCTTPKLDTSNASCAGAYLMDLTDTFAVTVTPSMFKLFDFRTYPDQKSWLRISAITDKEYNASEEFYLPDGITTEKDNLRDLAEYRTLCIENYASQFTRSLKELPSQIVLEHPCRYSYCYWQVAAHLEWLSNTRANRKFLIIMSDLFDKSPLFDVYSANGYMLLQNNPSAVAKLFQGSHPLPTSLSGVNVYIIYCPVSRFQDQVFKQIVKVYKLLLEPRGAIVHINTSGKFNTTY